MQAQPPQQQQAPAAGAAAGSASSSGAAPSIAAPTAGIKRSVAEMYERIEQRPHPQRAQTPAGLQAVLRPHQLQSLAFMQGREATDEKFGWLADEPGMGKTMVCLALCLADQQQQDVDYKHFDSRGVALPIPILERRSWYATCSICNCKKVRVAEQKMDGEKGLGPVKFLL